MNKTIVAIDPGASGGIAYHTRNSADPHALKMPATEGDVLAELEALAAGEPIAFVEQVTGYIPGRPQPGSRMFNFGRNFGFILGTLQALRYRIELVPPGNWQKALSLARNRESDTQWKNKLKARAQQLYPHLKVTLQTADALLLLEYAKRKQNHD